MLFHIRDAYHDDDSYPSAIHFAVLSMPSSVRTRNDSRLKNPIV